MTNGVIAARGGPLREIDSRANRTCAR